MFPLAPRRSARIAARATAAKKAVAAAASPPVPLRRSARLAVKAELRAMKERREVADFIRTHLEECVRGLHQTTCRTQRTILCTTFLKTVLTKVRKDKTFAKHLYSLEKALGILRSKCDTFMEEIRQNPTPNRIVNINLIITCNTLTWVLEGRRVWW
jgi:hypothetical protein